MAGRRVAVRFYRLGEKIQRVLVADQLERSLERSLRNERGFGKREDATSRKLTHFSRGGTKTVMILSRRLGYDCECETVKTKGRFCYCRKSE